MGLFKKKDKTVKVENNNNLNDLANSINRNTYGNDDITVYTEFPRIFDTNSGYLESKIRINPELFFDTPALSEFCNITHSKLNAQALQNYKNVLTELLSITNEIIQLNKFKGKKYEEIDYRFEEFKDSNSNLLGKQILNEINNIKDDNAQAVEEKRNSHSKYVYEERDVMFGYRRGETVKKTSLLGSILNARAASKEASKGVQNLASFLASLIGQIK